MTQCERIGHIWEAVDPKLKAKHLHCVQCGAIQPIPDTITIPVADLVGYIRESLRSGLAGKGLELARIPPDGDLPTAWRIRHAEEQSALGDLARNIAQSLVLLATKDG